MEENKEKFAETDVVGRLVEAMAIENNSVRKAVARTLAILSDHEELNEMIGEENGIEGFVSMKLLGDDAVGVEATKLIANLAKSSLLTSLIAAFFFNLFIAVFMDRNKQPS